ncbi:ATP-dependent protease LonB [Haloarchaeobius amylolyticus]|uniref:ATP-dependent protease LonB n=1 Tax=Haloarchaeobius amylolyticus TaxID=1198296 RepID=UPI00226E8153|nr:ATP-dependent protease LonB [Haloarchaeobius amylolyticus]
METEKDTSELTASTESSSDAGEYGPFLPPESPMDDSDEETAQLLGGLDIESTADVEVPRLLIDQVIGQDRARDIIEKAATQRRHVMMIGSPGTGKSMLSKAMAELLPSSDLPDVLVMHNEDDGNRPKVEVVPAGGGEMVVQEHRQRARKGLQLRWFAMWTTIILVFIYTIIVGQLLLGILAIAVVYYIFRSSARNRNRMVPKILIDNSDRTSAPFQDASGAHAGALLGDVRHDPYQSGGMETPSHDRVEPGAIHKANKGVLFIDEINTLEIRTQQKLLTALQEREYSITAQSDTSSGAMVHTAPVPCEFIMIAAGNLDAMENMHPALRSRIKGYGYEVYMDDTIEETPEIRQKYVRFVAQEVANDGRLPHFTRGAIAEVVREAQRRAGRQDHLTLRFRDLGGLVRVAGDIARDEDAPYTTRQHVLQAKRRARSIEQQIADDYIERRREYDLTVNEGAVVGRVNGLAVMGEDSGIVMPVMAEIAPSQGPGQVIATGKLQEIATESVHNVSAVVKKYSDQSLDNKDIHVQFVQAYDGVEGDSASVTVATAILSALTDVPVDQSVAMTGSLSVRGDVLPVGGVTHKVEAAVKAGSKTVIIPAANERDVLVDPEVLEQIEIIPVRHIGEVLDAALVTETVKHSMLEKLSKAASETFGEFTFGSGAGEARVESEHDSGTQ